MNLSKMETESHPDEIVITPSSPEKTLHWITVLAAAGLDYRLSYEKGEWHLHISAIQAARATREIDAFEEDEIRPRPPSRPTTSPILRTAPWTAFWCAYALVLFYLGMGSFDSTNPLHFAGAMSRTELLQGEWWRTVTALTLHSGLAHLLANIVFLFFVGQAVIRELGRGLGVATILAGGVLGNYLAALTASAHQLSVGASTACFAALGIISIVQAGHLYRRHQTWVPVWHQAWIPVAGGIALLGITGTSPGSDIAAHLFGFLAGALITIPAVRNPAIIANISIAMQWTLATIAALTPLLAWSLAYLQHNS